MSDTLAGLISAVCYLIDECRDMGLHEVVELLERSKLLLEAELARRAH
ncbi:MAG: hypothetical protein ACM31L_05275 [Actinomycetota bacterium]